MRMREPKQQPVSSCFEFNSATITIVMDVKSLWHNNIIPIVSATTPSTAPPSTSESYPECNCSTVTAIKDLQSTLSSQIKSVIGMIHKSKSNELNKIVHVCALPRECHGDECIVIMYICIHRV